MTQAHVQMYVCIPTHIHIVGGKFGKNVAGTNLLNNKTETKTCKYVCPLKYFAVMLPKHKYMYIHIYVYIFTYTSVRLSACTVCLKILSYINSNK